MLFDVVHLFVRKRISIYGILTSTTKQAFSASSGGCWSTTWNVALKELFLLLFDKRTGWSYEISNASLIQHPRAWKRRYIQNQPMKNVIIHALIKNTTSREISQGVIFFCTGETGDMNSVITFSLIAVLAWALAFIAFPTLTLRQWAIVFVCCGPWVPGQYHYLKFLFLFEMDVRQNWFWKRFSTL